MNFNPDNFSVILLRCICEFNLDKKSEDVKGNILDEVKKVDRDAQITLEFDKRTHLSFESSFDINKKLFSGT